MPGALNLYNVLPTDEDAMKLALIENRELG